MNNELQLTDEHPVDVNKLDTAQPLALIFQPFQTVLEKWEAKASALTVTDINQKAEMKMARAARLEVRDARLALELERKNRVEHLKARSSKIDAAARTVRVKLEALEETFRESEQFAERYEAKLKAELKIKREAELRPWLDGPDAPLLTDVSQLSEQAFVDLVEFYKTARKAKLDAAAKAEADRLAKEAAEKAERERIAAENARLKAEAEATAKRLEEERKAREAQEVKERAEREKERQRIEAERKAERERAAAEQAEKDRVAQKQLEAERHSRELERQKAKEESDRLRAKLEAEAKSKAAEQAKVEAERKAKAKAERIAAAAPDKKKLEGYIEAIKLVPIPVLQDEELPNLILGLRDTFTHQLAAIATAMTE